ncbi:ParB/RepB/Spo0J family partition protein [Jiangella endophytica]|uniref:ParB/RepB/Spo0J family partition protein n=1 Tax=Jiangella endophytica TaxID=1623398 RepID=UPI000E34A417|nr:ParB N-terminal domain-containing protein [Jiangella endophytica]
MSIVTHAAETTEAVEPQSGQPIVPALVMLDPHEVEPEENIRWNVDLDKAFVASVRQHGVLVPVLARTGSDGKILIRDGRRRLMAARETEHKLPAFVVDVSDEKTARIIEQYVTNFHRRALSTAEEAVAWQQLALEGMSAATIARRTGTKRATVEAGLTVARHEAASQAVADYDITLEQAAVLIRLEEDPEAVEQLRKVAKSDPARFDHRAQELLDARERKDELARLRADYEAKGVTVVDWPSWNDTNVAFLDRLRTADGERVTEETHAGTPGYAVAVGESWRGVSAEPVIVAWSEHGLRHVDAQGKTARGPMTEEEKEGRRVVVANNRAWASAEKVRRAWIRKLLGRKKLPTDAVAFSVSVLVEESFAIERAVSKGHPMAGALLGAEVGTASEYLARMVAESRSKTVHVLLAVALGALESSIERSTWRNPSGRSRRYLMQLAAWGYTLSDVEQLAIAETEPVGQDDRVVEAPIAEPTTTVDATSAVIGEPVE